MTVLDRLNMELNHKDYFTNDEYSIYLQEEGLTSTDTYNKDTMQRKLLLTIVDILEAVSNDIDLMRKISDETTNMNIGECYKLLESRVQNLKNRIATIPDDTINDDNSIVMLFTKERM